MRTAVTSSLPPGLRLITLSAEYVNSVADHRYNASHEVGTEIRVAYAQWLIAALVQGNYVGWLLVDDHSATHAVVAGAGLSLLDWGPTPLDPNPLRARLANVYVEPSYRRKGLARMLVKQAIGFARERGINTLSLSATEMSAPLYAQLGFKA
jgi:GNAT superfamily N-acetyltransferase